VRAVKAGVDLCAVHEVGVALEMGEFGVAWPGEVMGVKAGNGPAGGSDMEV
jgi:hypothetical protein